MIRFSHSHALGIAFTISALCGCSAPATSATDEATESTSEAVLVSNQLDCDASNVCTVPNMPLLCQTSDLIDVDIPQANKDVGCYDTSIDTVLAASIANRTSTQALTGRALTFSNIVAGNNGKSPPTATTKAYEQLSQEYRWTLNQPAVQPFYFQEILNSFSGTSRRFPAGCDPNTYGSCWFMTLTAGDFSGASFRDFTGQVSSHVTNDYVKGLMSEGFATLIAYGRYDAAPCPDAPSVTCFTKSSQHKVVFSGSQPGAYPLRINDVGDGAQRNVTLSDDISVFGINGAARLPNGKSKQTFLRYDPAVSPTPEIFFIEHIDGLSLGLKDRGVSQAFSGTWGSGFTNFMPFTMAGVPHQIAYNATTGLVHFDRYFQNVNGAETLWSWTWGTGWSHFVPYYINGAPYFVAYNQSTGEMQFDTFPQNLQGPIIFSSKALPMGFTSLVPFTMNGQNYLIMYNKNTGAVRFDRFNGSGSDMTNIWTWTWGSGFTDFVPYYLAGEPYLIAYDSSIGLMHYDKISPFLNGTDGLAAFTTSTGCKLAGVEFAGPGHFVSYRTGGIAEFNRMTLDGSQSGISWQSGVLAMASTVISFKQNGFTYELMYDKVSGNVQIYKLDLF